MGLPAPSPEQEAALTAAKAVAEAGVTGAVEKEAAFQSALDVQQEIEDFQKATFDALTLEIIDQYETERRWIDGQDVSAKINEADVQSFAAGDENSRLWNNGDFTPVRISRFDGAPLTFEQADNEIDLFDNQDVLLTLLQTGYPGQITLDNGAEIKDAIDAGSTSLTIINNLSNIDNGDVLFVSGGGFTGLLEVTNVVQGGVCSGEDNPPQLTEALCLADNGTWSTEDAVDFNWLLSPSGTIPANSDIGQKTFGGFNNTERTNQTASDSDFQGFMDSLLGDLVANFNKRKTALNNQIASLDANGDENLDANAKVNCNTSISGINSILGATPPSTMDVSDAGIVVINNERDVRKPEALTRITDAVNAGAAYYDQRYNTSEGRCRLNNGSIVLVNDLTEAIAGAQAGGAESQGLADRYNDLIP